MPLTTKHAVTQAVHMVHTMNVAKKFGFGSKQEGYNYHTLTHGVTSNRASSAVT